eukprot:s2509_g13.t2
MLALDEVLSGQTDLKPPVVQSIRLIKIDVEGMETNVVETAPKDLMCTDNERLPESARWSVSYVEASKAQVRRRQEEEKTARWNAGNHDSTEFFRKMGQTMADTERFKATCRSATLASPSRQNEEKVSLEFAGRYIDIAKALADFSNTCISDDTERGFKTINAIGTVDAPAGLMHLKDPVAQEQRRQAETEAATKVQAMERGRKARKQAKEERETVEEEEPSQESAPAPGSSSSLPNEGSQEVEPPPAPPLPPPPAGEEEERRSASDNENDDAFGEIEEEFSPKTDIVGPIISIVGAPATNTSAPNSRKNSRRSSEESDSGGESEASENPDDERLLSTTRSSYNEQAEVIGTLLETVWWVKVEFELQAQRLSQMEEPSLLMVSNHCLTVSSTVGEQQEKALPTRGLVRVKYNYTRQMRRTGYGVTHLQETLERQAARIATLEAREPLAASPKKPSPVTAAETASSSKAVDLLGLDPFERASEPQATARKDRSCDWADVEDDDDEEADMPVEKVEEGQGPMDGSRHEDRDPWLEAAAAKRGTSFLDKPAAAAPAAPRVTAKKAAPLQLQPAPRGLLECVDSSVASAGIEVSEELMAKLMQAVHSKKLMEPAEGLPQPSNGTTNGNSPPVTPVPKKAPPAALQAASKASLQKWPPKPPIVRFRAQCEFSAQFKSAEVKEERRRSIQQAQERKQIKIDAKEVIQDMTLTWINMYFKLDVVTPRDLTAGFSIIILTMMDVIYPKKVRWHQVEWNVAYMRALAHNHRVLEKHWNEVNMDKVKDLRRDRIGMSIENTLDASIEDKLHFLKQVKRWFDCRVQHSAAYDPIKRRTEVEKQIRLTGRLMKFPTWMQYDKEEVQASRATKPEKNKRRSEQTEPTTEYEKMPEFKRLLWFLGSEHQTM